MFKKILSHPLSRGMLSYSITWPTGAFIEEFCNKKNLDDIDWKKCIRFSVYGAFFISPVLYCWVRTAHRIWPEKTLATAIKKAALETITYNPFSTATFFLVTTFIETRSYEKAREELRNKFWDTYKVSACYWPFVQTINFAFIPYRNRLVFVSFCGLFWIMFLAYVQEYGSPLERKKLKSNKPCKPSE